MSFRHSLRSRPAPWLRVLAVVCAGLVFTLSAAAFSPALHAWLHGHPETSAHSHAHAACTHAHAHETTSSDDPHHDKQHECAVTLFAHGVNLAAVFLSLLDYYAVSSAAAPLAPGRAALVTSEHLRPQPHAPPVG